MQLTAAILCLAASAAFVPSGQEADSPTEIFPQPKGSLVIQSGGEGMNHADLARAFAEVTGLNIVLSSEASKELQALPVEVLGDLEIPPNQVYPVIESMLIEAGFYLAEIGNGAPHVYMLRSTRSNGRAATSKARLVDSDRIDEYRDHPAVLVRTVLHLSLDARQLTNSLRSLLTDSNMQAAIPIGNSNSLALVGTGRDVAEFTTLLRDADAAHVRAMEEERVAHEEALKRQAKMQKEAGSEPAGEK